MVTISSTFVRTLTTRSAANGASSTVIRPNSTGVTSQYSPASSTRYLLRVDGREELQTSSGVWIATASGATGAMRSAGGRPMSGDDRRLQYKVREPYVRVGTSVALVGGSTDDPIALVARSPKLLVYLDGHRRTQAVRFGAQVTLATAPKPLRVVGYQGGG